MNDTVNHDIFSTVFGKIRGKIIRTLSEEPLKFSDLQKRFGISSSKLNYHLKELSKAFVQKENGKYTTSELGAALLNLLHRWESTSVQNDQVKVASIGFLIAPHDLELNIKQALRAVDLLAFQGAGLVNLPFIHITNPQPAEKVLPPFIRKAKDLRAHISLGLFETSNDKKYYSTVLVNPEGEFKIYRSIHRNLITVKTDVGDDIIVADTEIGKIGLACGNEYLSPELFRILRLKGADYVICPTFGLPDKFQKILKSMLVARAIENQLIVAVSSSGFFQNEPFAFTISPYHEFSFENNIESVSIIEISKNTLRNGREYFKLLSRRSELYQELVKEYQPQLDLTFFFPRKIIRKYEVIARDLVKIEQLEVFEKPLGLNIPRTGYMVAPIFMKDTRDVEFFDDFGPLNWTMIKKEPSIEFLAPARIVMTHGKLYSFGFRFKTSDQIKAKGRNVFLNIDLEDYNKLSAIHKVAVNELEVNLIIGKKFKIVSSHPNYSLIKSSKKDIVFIWKWYKPERIPQLRIKLREV